MWMTVPKLCTGLVQENGHMHYFDAYFCEAYIGRHAVRGGTVAEARDKLRNQLAEGGYKRYYTAIYEVK